MKNKYEDTRHLPVPLTEPELLDFGQQLARACKEHEHAENQRKLTAAQLKGDVDSKAATVDRLTSIVSSKEEVRKIACLWQMNTPKPGQKSLIRLDTQASIEMRDMTGEDVQGELELEETETLGDAVARMGEEISTPDCPVTVTASGPLAEARVPKRGKRG